MLKKIVLGTLFIGLIGVLVAGAAVRTMDGTALAAEAFVVEFDKALEGEPRAWRTNDWRIHESLSKSLLRVGEKAFGNLTL